MGVQGVFEFIYGDPLEVPDVKEMAIVRLPARVVFQVTVEGEEHLNATSIRPELEIEYSNSAVEAGTLDNHIPSLAMARASQVAPKAIVVISERGTATPKRTRDH
jgi:hypothetical protein